MDDSNQMKNFQTFKYLNKLFIKHIQTTGFSLVKNQQISKSELYTGWLMVFTRDISDPACPITWGKHFSSTSHRKTLKNAFIS